MFNRILQVGKRNLGRESILRDNRWKFSKISKRHHNHIKKKSQRILSRLGKLQSKTMFSMFILLKEPTGKIKISPKDGNEKNFSQRTCSKLTS